ncbi:MAG: glycosyltransferase 2 family protein [Tenuifilum sp.]|nr:glycosyltransferase 2 family protein [Tenuifilum sp.]
MTHQYHNKYFTNKVVWFDVWPIFVKAIATLNLLIFMKAILRVFLYVSILALLFYLIRIDYVAFEKIHINYYLAAISVVLLYLGFIFSAISWKKILNLHDVNITTKQAIVSHGMPTFTKYIPGRVWTILGRAALIPNSNNIKLLSFISLKEQLIYLNLGLIISIYPVISTPGLKRYSVLLILLSFFMLLTLYLKSLHKLIEKTWNKLFHRKIELPLITKKEFISISLYILTYWLIWTMAFYLLLCSVFGQIPIYYSFAFPLSVSLGLMSLVLPGGIGIREGAITLFLITNGIQPELAASFSVLSRLWFIVGESLIFSTSLFLRKRN